MIGKKLASSAAAAAMMIFAAAPAIAEPHVAPVEEFVKTSLKAQLADAVVIAALKAQNAKTGPLSQGDIDAMDQQWRVEVDAGGGSLVEEKLGSDLSKFLKMVRDGQKGTVTELFVMDARGLNVGQSDPTSDYWQGDEDKWQKTFGSKADVIFVDGVEQDESTQMLQSQASFTILDPATGELIGAATVGINLDALGL